MPPKDLFIIAQVYRCCQYIILGDGRYKGAAPKRPDRRGQIAAMRQLCCRSCVSCRSKVILRRYKGSSKSKDREAPPQTALREGAELNSPSNMFLGLPLRSKSVLRNSGRICLASRSQGNVCFASSSTTERARLPHWNEATCGFRSPALVGRIDFGEIELRGKRPDSVPLLADCSFRLLRTKLFFAAKDFVLLVYSLLPSCFALETANAVPHNKEGFFPTSTHLFIT